ncbi:MAG: GNAT family N-acetyltransferase [Gemmatimonadales bacterium]|nr:GNAT family N-acetyltransferase [Gemmatimonadales bacterium]
MTGASGFRRQVTIRPYHAADRAEWLRMRLALWPDIADGDPDADADAWLARADAIVLVAEREDGRGLAGFAELGTRPYADGCRSSPVAYLEGWYVDADMRRRGVGAALVRAGEAWGRARGCVEIGSDALIDNTISVRAHEALGFASVERLVHFLKDLGGGR